MSGSWLLLAVFVTLGRLFIRIGQRGGAVAGSASKTSARRSKPGAKAS